jgi:hypothetical protein
VVRAHGLAHAPPVRCRSGRGRRAEDRHIGDRAGVLDQIAMRTISPGGCGALERWAGWPALSSATGRRWARRQGQAAVGAGATTGGQERRPSGGRRNCGCGGGGGRNGKSSNSRNRSGRGRLRSDRAHGRPGINCWSAAMEKQAQLHRRPLEPRRK